MVKSAVPWKRIIHIRRLLAIQYHPVKLSSGFLYPLLSTPLLFSRLPSSLLLSSLLLSSPSHLLYLLSYPLSSTPLIFLLLHSSPLPSSHLFFSALCYSLLQIIAKLYTTIA